MGYVEIPEPSVDTLVYRDGGDTFAVAPAAAPEPSPTGGWDLTGWEPLGAVDG